MSNGNNNQPRLPTDRQRLAIIGDTGSGKTVAALWHLSRRNFDRIPWVVIDYKGDENIEAIDRAEIRPLDWTPAKREFGLFVLRPLPEMDDEAVEDFLRRIYERENVGLWIDEGLMVDRSGWTKVLITQGRSKRIPLIMLSQRPVDVSRYLWSNSEYFQYFPSGDDRDSAVVANFVRGLRERGTGDLPRYWSYYYDRGRKALHTWKPVDAPERSIERINAKLKQRRRFL